MSVEHTYPDFLLNSNCQIMQMACRISTGPKKFDNLSRKNCDVASLAG